MSIPATVTRVLKYIPELQQQVQKLAKEKEELLARIPSKVESQEDSRSIHQGGRQQRISGSAEGSVSANRLSEREVAVQISTQKGTESPLSEIMLSLERDGFSLINASAFESHGDNRAFYTLHIQVLLTTFIRSTFRSEKLLLNREQGTLTLHSIDITMTEKGKERTLFRTVSTLPSSHLLGIKDSINIHSNSCVPLWLLG